MSPSFQPVSPQVDTVKAAILASDPPGRIALRTWLQRIDADGRPREGCLRRDPWVQGTIALILAMSPPDRLLIRRWTAAWVSDTGTIATPTEPKRSVYSYPPSINFDKPTK